MPIRAHSSCIINWRRISVLLIAVAILLTILMMIQVMKAPPESDLFMGCFRDFAPNSTKLIADKFLSDDASSEVARFDIYLSREDVLDAENGVHSLPFDLKDTDAQALQHLSSHLRRDNPHQSTTSNQSLMSPLVGSSSNSSKKCVVIGSGGILNQHRLGPEIDTFYDVVIRINAAPVEGFEDRVGSKTHVRILSRKNFLLVPEPRTEFFKDSLMVFVLMVPSRDEPWLQKEILDKNGMLSRLKENVRIMNPKIVMEAWKWLKYDFKPSTGLMAINYALHTCGLVDIAGFSYQCHHSAQLHYYETSTRTWDWTGWGTILSFHSYEAEGQLVKSMVKAGIIGDITGATREFVPTECAATKP